MSQLVTRLQAESRPTSRKVSVENQVIKLRLEGSLLPRDVME